MPGFDASDELEVTEKRTIKRLTIRNLFASALEAFNIERGGVFTIKRLFTAPGHLVTDFIGAGRYRYVGPFKLLVITTTLALLILSQSHFGGSLNVEFDKSLGVSEGMKAMTEAYKRMLPYLNLVLWIYIPIMALFGGNTFAVLLYEKDHDAQ